MKGRGGCGVRLSPPCASCLPVASRPVLVCQTKLTFLDLPHNGLEGLDVEGPWFAGDEGYKADLAQIPRADTPNRAADIFHQPLRAIF